MPKLRHSHAFFVWAEPNPTGRRFYGDNKSKRHSFTHVHETPGGLDDDHVHEVGGYGGAQFSRHGLPVKAG